MEDLNDKITGDNLKASQWNQPTSETQNVIENTGQSLTNSDLNQLGKGIAQYAANGNFYTDSGAGNAYVLTQIGLKQTTPAYVDGMAVEFIPSNSNTGSATINVASLGVKNISATASGNEILSGSRITLRYNINTGEFEIFQTVSNNVTAGLVYGLVTSNGTDTNNDIDIATGECADSTNAILLNLSSIITKQLDAAWAAGANVGGLFSGTKAADTWYHVFLIRKDSDGSIDAGFDTSLTAANIPSGYTAFRRIGSILTDGSANIYNFTQIGDEFIWDTIKQDVSVAGAGTFAVLRQISTPLEINILARLVMTLYNDNSTVCNYEVQSPLKADEIIANFTGITNVATGSSFARRKSNIIDVMTDTGSRVRTRLSAAIATTQYIGTISYKDTRGQS